MKHSAAPAFLSLLNRKSTTVVTPGPTLDPDAEAFLTASDNMGDLSIVEAIDAFVVGLKADSLYTLLHAVYPFVGSTAERHKWNLINPTDSDAAYRLTFEGGWTHSFAGITGNEIDTGANTHFAPDDAKWTSTSASFGFYSGVDTDEPGWDMACGDGTGQNLIIARRFTNNVFLSCRATGYLSAATLDSLGLYHANRVSATQGTGYKNGTLLVNAADVSAAAAVPIYIGCYNNGGVLGNFTTRTYSFAFIGAGMTAPQAVAFYDRVQALQTALARQV